MKLSNSKGFTLIELLISMAIGLIVSAVITSFVANGMRLLQVNQETNRLAADALFVSDRLAFLIKQAQLAENNTPTSLNLTKSDGTVSTIEQKNQAITVDNSPISTQNSI